LERLPARFDVEFSFKAYRKFSILNKFHSFDLIHGHGFSSLGILIARKMMNCSIPIVTTIHCLRYTQRRANKKALEVNKKTLEFSLKTLSKPFLLWEAFQEKIIVENSDFLLAVSEGVKRDITNVYGIPSEKIYVVGNGVDTMQFSPSDRLPISRTKQINLLWIGRFSGFKGELDLISSCDILKKQGVQFHLEMIGDGEGRIQASQYVKDLCLYNNIEIIPYIPNSQISRHYRKAHVFILPSVSEGMPKVVLEAMACACPIIVSDIPGCRELVTDGKNGFLVPIGRPDLFADAVLTFYKYPNLINEMGSKSRKIVEDNYTWDAVAQRMEECYHSVLRNREKST
jgi:glycosyltransferase involved in cell wall biosynthesis